MISCISYPKTVKANIEYRDFFVTLCYDDFIDANATASGGLCLTQVILEYLNDHLHWYQCDNWTIEQSDLSPIPMKITSIVFNSIFDSSFWSKG